MGSKLSKNIYKWNVREGQLKNNKRLYEIKEEPQCLICWESIGNIHARCIGCNIRMHSACEERYRKTEERNYCLCPHCKKVGTLAITMTKTMK